MRFLKGALVGLFGGWLLAVVVNIGVIAHGERPDPLVMFSCAAHGWCIDWVAAPIVVPAFALGFAAGFAWFLRRPRQVVQ